MGVTMRKVYEALGEMIPYKKRLEKVLRYAGVSHIYPRKYAGFIFLYSLGVGIVSFVISYLFLYGLVFSLIIGFTGFVGFQAIVYIVLTLIAGKRANIVEEVLPDALQLMSANIRAGMTMDRAIWLSARPEFGPLEKEIKRVGSEVLGGEEMLTALETVKKNVDSILLDRAIRLIEEGIKSGGEMAHLLDETAADIRNTQAMKAQVKSNVTMYSMFIIFASVIGAPILFAVSLYFIDVTNQLWGQQMVGLGEGLSQMAGGMFSPSAPKFTASELRIFSVACILLTTTFGGLIIGLIQTGKEKNGLKYIPLLALGGLGIFFTVNFLITLLFGSLVGF